MESRGRVTGISPAARLDAAHEEELKAERGLAAARSHCLSLHTQQAEGREEKHISFKGALLMYLMCWYSKKKNRPQKTAQHGLWLVFSCAVSGYFPHEAVQKAAWNEMKSLKDESHLQTWSQ